MAGDGKGAGSDWDGTRVAGSGRSCLPITCVTSSASGVCSSCGGMGRRGFVCSSSSIIRISLKLLHLSFLSSNVYGWQADLLGDRTRWTRLANNKVIKLSNIAGTLSRCNNRAVRQQYQGEHDRGIDS